MRAHRIVDATNRTGITIDLPNDETEPARPGLHDTIYAQAKGEGGIVYRPDA